MILPISMSRGEPECSYGLLYVNCGYAFLVYKRLWPDALPCGAGAWSYPNQLATTRPEVRCQPPPSTNTVRFTIPSIRQTPGALSFLRTDDIVSLDPCLLSMQKFADNERVQARQ